MLSYAITACETAQWDVPDILLNIAVTAVKNRGSIGMSSHPLTFISCSSNHPSFMLMLF